VKEHLVTLKNGSIYQQEEKLQWK